MPKIIISCYELLLLSFEAFASFFFSKGRDLHENGKKYLGLIFLGSFYLQKRITAPASDSVSNCSSERLESLRGSKIRRFSTTSRGSGDGAGAGGQGALKSRLGWTRRAEINKDNLDKEMDDYWAKKK